jgi:hypothetical protein
VGVGEGVTDVNEAAHQFAQFHPPLRTGQTTRPVETVDRLLQAFAANEPHGVKRPIGIVATLAVNRHDSGMLQAPRDFGLGHESGSATRVK